MVNSSPVASNQQGINDDLLRVVSKHLDTDFLKPVAEHTASAFAKINERVRDFGGPVIIDSGCGTGESSYRLASKYPTHLIVGVDKSATRLAKSATTNAVNVELVRADLVDIWRLMKGHKWPIDKHYVLYPNPWPKKQHLKRRWHGHPVFLSMLQLCEKLELRTNWELYALEFVAAVKHLIGQGVFAGEVSYATFEAIEPISHFEKKYARSAHPLYRVAVEVLRPLNV